MGNMGSYADWRVGLVQESVSGEVTYHNLGAGTLSRVDGFSSTDTLTLTVMAIAPDAEFEEQFAYRYLWQVGESADPNEPESSPEDIEQPKSACSYLPFSETMLWFSGLWLAFTRRERGRLT